MPPTTAPISTIRIGSRMVARLSAVLLDLVVVHDGQALEHLIERTGLLTDLDHLDDERREERVEPHGRGEGLAFTHRRLDLLDRFAERGVPDPSETMSSASITGTPAESRNSASRRTG